MLRAASSWFSMHVFTTFLGTLSIIYFSRVLGPSTLGQYFLFLAIGSIIILFIGLGLSIGQPKRMSEDEKEDEYSSAGLLIRIALLGPCILILNSIRNPLNQYFGNEITLLLISFIFLRQIYNWIDSVLYGFNKITTRAIIRSGKEFSRVLLQVILVYLGFGLSGLLYSLITAEIIGLVTAIYFSNIKLVLPSFETIKDLLRFSVLIFGSRAGVKIYEWADTLLIGFLVSPAAVGIYEVAWNVYKLLLLPSDAISTPLLPEISGLKNLSQHRILIESSFLVSIIIPVGAFFGSLIVSRDLLSTVFGADFGMGSTVLIILSLAAIFASIESVVSTILISLDFERTYFYFVIIRTVVNILLNLLLIPLVGIEGAAIATLLSISMYTIIAVYYTNRTVNSHFPYLNASPIVAAGAGMIFFLSLLQDIALYLLISLGGIIYTMLLIPFSIKYLKNRSTQIRKILNFS